MAEQYWYVDNAAGTSTDNTSHGATTGEAFKTLQYALDILVVGNTVNSVVVALPYTVVCKGGVTETISSGSVITFDTNQGTGESTRITVMADRFGQHFGVAAEATINGSGTAYPCLQLSGKSYITIDGFELINFRGAAIYLEISPLGIIIENCWIHGSTQTNYYVNGIYAHTCTFTSGAPLICRNNIIHDLEGNGNSDGHTCGINGYISTYIMIYNNTIYDILSSGGNGWITGSGTGGICFYNTTAKPGVFRVYNNIIKKCDYHCIGFVWANLITNVNLTSNNNVCDHTGTTTHNLGATIKVDGTNGVYYTDLATTAPTWQSAGYDANGSETDPLFENTTVTLRQHLKIKYGSSAIGLGTPIVDNRTTNTVSTIVSTISNGLLRYWKCNEDSWNGTANEVVDSSGNADHGVASGNATTAAGKFSNCGTFDGTGDYVTFAAAQTVPDALTTSAWIYCSVNPNEGTNCVIAWGNSGGTSLTEMGINPSIVSGLIYLEFYIYNDASNYKLWYSTVYMPLGKWHHIAVTQDAANNTPNLFVNGMKQLGVLYGGSTGTTTRITQTLALGRHGAGAYYYLKGNIDDASIWNRVLADSEIYNIYMAGVGNFPIKDNWQKPRLITNCDAGAHQYRLVKNQ